jgi:hypothetical protein
VYSGFDKNSEELEVSDVKSTKFKARLSEGKEASKYITSPLFLVPSTGTNAQPRSVVLLC